MDWFWFLLAGIFSGVIGGMGMGGGTLLIPVLTIILNVAQRTAQGLNLLVFLPMSIVALVIHIKNKLVNFRVGLIIIASGIVTSVLGSILALNLSNEILQKFFGGFLLIVGVWQIIETILNIKKDKKKKNVVQPNKYKFVVGYKNK